MKVFAHRGVSALYPENSKTALAACLNSDIFGVEIDLYQAGDDFFISHDPWLSRLFGINKKLTNLTTSEATKLLCQDGQTIANLEWLIKTFAGQKLMLNIELKAINDLELFANKLTSLMTQYNFDLSDLLLSSFYHPYLQQLQQLQPDWPIGVLLAHCPLDVSAYFQQLKLYSLHLSVEAISADLVAVAKQHNIQVFVYTVDQAEDIQQLLDYKVDGIFANHPEQASKIIKNLI